jgi:hypothetical protein
MLLPKTARSDCVGRRGARFPDAIAVVQEVHAIQVGDERSASKLHFILKKKRFSNALAQTGFPAKVERGAGRRALQASSRERSEQRESGTGGRAATTAAGQPRASAVVAARAKQASRYPRFKLRQRARERRNARAREWGRGPARAHDRLGLAGGSGREREGTRDTRSAGQQAQWPPTTTGSERKGDRAGKSREPRHGS